MAARLVIRWSVLVWVLFIVSGLTEAIQAQGLRVVLRDSVRREPLVGASVQVAGTSQGALTDKAGVAVLTPAPAAGTHLQVASLGFVTRVVLVPETGGELLLLLLLLLLRPGTEKYIEQEVLVTATRTNSRIKNLPTRVEVLGAEEIEEEGSIKPASIASLFGDTRAPRFSRPRPPPATWICVCKACRANTPRFCAMACRCMAASRARLACSRCHPST